MMSVLFIMVIIFFIAALVVDSIVIIRESRGSDEKDEMRVDDKKGIRIRHTVMPDKMIEYNSYWMYIKENIKSLRDAGAFDLPPKYNDNEKFNLKNK